MRHLTLALLAILLLAAPVRAQRYMENLGRGVVGVNQGGDVFLSWRLLATDPADVGFNVYRTAGEAQPVKLNSTPLTGPTLYVDKGAKLGTATSYFVRAVVGGAEQAPSAPFKFAADAPANPYLTVPLQTPEGYAPNDASVGDLDGDGEYEIVLHQTGRAHDNSQGGETDPPILEAYKLDGTLLWRINLGKNIREGAHYTQFMVYDFDGDGRAEVACKTADGSVDGKGKVIGDEKADYRNPNGWILAGPEFLTVFDGLTGAELATTDYIPPRHPRRRDPSPDELKQVWGDGYGNRVDRFLACVAYLDGVRPSFVMCRGYYTRTVLAAWDWRDGKLTKRWVFDSEEGGAKNKKFAGQGNHNLSVADVDGDGKDEIIYGGMAIDDDGKGLYTTGLGHGDAMHVSDLDPDHPGLEVFRIQERFDDAGAHMFDAKTGEILWKKPSVKAGGDGEGPGRGLALDIDPRTKGAECWVAGAGVAGLFDCKGNVISPNAPRACNFGVWWDGDLLREILDRTMISKWNWETSQLDRLVTANDCSSNNGTKATPCLSGDIFGDWREEVIWRTSDNKELRIYTTTIPTKYRFITLMQDPEYRLSIAWQNVSYNQPPHTSFYLGEGMSPPPRPAILTSRAAGAKTGSAAAASARVSPGSAAQAAVWQEKLRALAERRQAAAAAATPAPVEIKNQLLVIKGPDGKAQVLRANSIADQGAVVVGDLGDGRKGVWQKNVVLAVLPAFSDQDLESGAADLPAAIARYELAEKSSPEPDPLLDAELTRIKAAEARHRAKKEELEAKFAALSARAYDPAQPYTMDELGALVTDAEALRAELPAKQAKIDAALAPFQEHLSNLIAGKRYYEGAWHSAEEVEFEDFKGKLTFSIDPFVMTRAQLFGVIKMPIMVLAGVLLFGVVLLVPKRTRGVGSLLVVVALGGGAYLGTHFRGGPNELPVPKEQTASSGDPLARALWLAARSGPASGGHITITDADLNGFISRYISFADSSGPRGDLYRTALAAQVVPDGLLVRERLRLDGKFHVAGYRLKLSHLDAAPEITVQSVEIDGLGVPDALKKLLWDSLSEQLKPVTASLGKLKVIRVGKGELEVAASPQ